MADLPETSEKSSELERKYGPPPPDIRTLGMLLTDARSKMGLTRASLSKKTGISPNTLAKYEKAGSPGGKIPTAGKLAVICLYLQLDPREALLYSLGDGAGEWLQFMESGKYVHPHWLEFQDFIHQLEQLALLGHQNKQLRISDIEEGLRSHRAELEEVRTEVTSMLADLTDTIQKQVSKQQNGPGQKDLGRSVSKNETEAVGAASQTSDPKKRSDE